MHIIADFIKTKNAAQKVDKLPIKTLEICKKFTRKYLTNFWKTETEKKPNQTVFYKQILAPAQPAKINLLQIYSAFELYMDTFHLPNAMYVCMYVFITIS